MRCEQPLYNIGSLQSCKQSSWFIVLTLKVFVMATSANGTMTQAGTVRLHNMNGTTNAQRLLTASFFFSCHEQLRNLIATEQLLHVWLLSHGATVSGTLCQGYTCCVSSHQHVSLTSDAS